MLLLNLVGSPEFMVEARSTPHHKLNILDRLFVVAYYL